MFAYVGDNDHDHDYVHAVHDGVDGSWIMSDMIVMLLMFMVMIML